jgi:penicillin-binding protein 1C
MFKKLKLYKKQAVVGTTCFLLCIAYYFCLPEPLFRPVFATVLEDRQGRLLSATIAADEQWRFPACDTVPDKFKHALLLFEDRHFFSHWGVNPFSMLRACWQNINQGRIVSGGSTLSMQVIRLSRNQPRTFYEKLIEIILATRLEFSYSKNEILALYASHAPFGGNIVGLNAASWRYFGRSPKRLSWAEAAVLAVLPNSPGLIYPGKNHYKLLQKRDRLLDKLHQKGYFDELTLQLAKAEPIPDKPAPLPMLATHLLTRNIHEGRQGKIIKTTLDLQLQSDVQQVLSRYQYQLSGNEIYNIAALVLDVETGEVLAYAGNVSAANNRQKGSEVDVITAPRSTGSILKPFLYAAMLDEGKILPKTLVADIPTFLKGFAPKNFSKTYDGAVPAHQALSRSLNVPAVRMLQDYGVEKLHFLLKEMGMQTLHHAPSHYGLSLILGGAEASLWDITGMYASMARTLKNYFLYPYPKRYHTEDYHAPGFMPKTQDRKKRKGRDEYSLLSAGAIWHTFEAMTEVYRPVDEMNWRMFSSSQKIAWKTGTSFGHRDAWAVGLTPRYVVGVWAGNASGEGRPGLTGVEAAAPVMFDIFHLLPSAPWFEKPLSDLEKIGVCRSSGHKAMEICQPMDSLYVPKAGLLSVLCPYHEQVFMDGSGKFRVNSDCEPVRKMVSKSWFVLPPVMEWYYKSKNAGYKVLPPYRDDCGSGHQSIASMQIIYPDKKTHIFVPRELDGSLGNSVFEVAHRNPETKIFWHLDEVYLGYTKRIHQMGVAPGEGKHVLTLVDENGEVLQQDFEVIGR